MTKEYSSLSYGRIRSKFLNKETQVYFGKNRQD